MTHRTLWLALLACAGCVTTASQKEPTKASATAAEYYPLGIGTAWTYEVKQLAASSTVEVSMVKKVADGFVEDTTGAQFLSDSYGVRDQKRYLLRNPIEAGTKWSNVVSVSSVENYEIVSAGQPCEVPAGHWENCVVVEGRNRAQEGVLLVNEMTFAPRVGIVKVTVVLETQGKIIPQTSLNLLKFSPAP